MQILYFPFIYFTILGGDQLIGFEIEGDKTLTIKQNTGSTGIDGLVYDCGYDVTNVKSFQPL